MISGYMPYKLHYRTVPPGVGDWPLVPLKSVVDIYVVGGGVMS